MPLVDTGVAVVDNRVHNRGSYYRTHNRGSYCATIPAHTSRFVVFLHQLRIDAGMSLITLGIETGYHQDVSRNWYIRSWNPRVVPLDDHLQTLGYRLCIRPIDDDPLPDDVALPVPVMTRKGLMYELREAGR